MEILPSLLSFIDSKVRTFKRKISDAAENPNEVAEQIADNLPETIDKTISDPSNFVGGGAGTLVSRGAKTWNNPRYVEAIKMKVKGAKDEEIWNRTGTWLDTPDMIPRQEISDLDMKIRGWEPPYFGISKKEGGFHSAIEHPLLTASHPELLKDLQVELAKSPDHLTWGKYVPNQNLLRVEGKTDQDILYILSHELQHVIQHANKFASGGSPKNITLEMQPLFMKLKDEMLQRGDPEKYATEQAAKTAYKALAGEAEARAVMDRLLEGLKTGKHPEVGPWKHYDVDPKNTIVHFYNRK